MSQIPPSVLTKLLTGFLEDFDFIYVDLFCGGGGASEGITEALGSPPIVALNHDEEAIAMHAANHPRSIHLCENILKVDPWDALKLPRGRRLDFLWASPDCTHFSKARGGKPRDKGIRSLAWELVSWLAKHAPRAFGMENVEEFLGWCPLDENGQPVKEPPDLDEDGKPILPKLGSTFKEFIARLNLLGYRVEWRVLNAADYGAPTARKRLFLVGRNDGKKIEWPEPTHGPVNPKKPARKGRGKKKGEAAPEAEAPPEKKLLPYRTAAECIDWTVPTLSIFATPTEAKAWAKETGAAGVPRRPLAEATQRRIAEGIKRYVLESPSPFIVRIGHQSSDAGKVRSTEEPLSVITSKNEHALITPTLAPVLVANNTNNAPQTVEDPLGAITTGGRHILVAPLLTKARSHGWDRNGGPSQPADRPLPVIIPTETHALAVPYLVRYHGEKHPAEKPRTESVDAPLPTQTAEPRFGLATATLIQTGYGERKGQKPRALNLMAPLGTNVAGGIKHALVTAWIARHFTGVVGAPVTRPLPTVTGVDHHSLVTADLAPAAESAEATPAPAAQDRRHDVYAFLLKYHSQGSQWQGCDEPLHTIDATDRYGVVTVTIDGEEYVITDIGLRMLTPRELATAQGFPKTYTLTGSKSSQVRRIGNSVCRHVVRAVVSSLFREELAARKLRPEQNPRPTRRASRRCA